MIDVASCKHVSKNELTPGGMVAAISAINSSGIGPGPLGIADTSPIADAPASIAIHASATLAIQQIFTRGFIVKRFSHKRHKKHKKERSEEHTSELQSQFHLVC